MWLIGTYKDINNNTITVKIRNEKNGDNIELGGALVKFAAEDAVTIDCDRDDYFTHIIKKSATIRLVTRIYLGDYLWAANQKSVIVNILRNGKCVFAGYVTPNTYTQDYVEEWTTLDVNCRDLLSTLEDTNFVDKDKYDDFKQNAQTISLKDYLKLFGIMNANLNLDNYPQPMFMSHFIWITDGYIYQDGVFYAKLIEVEQVTIDGQVKNIATGNYKRGKVLEPNWILDETKTTTYNGLKYNLEFAYLDIDGNGTYETRTNVSRRTAEPIFDQVYRDTVTYGDVIEQIHLEEYTVITNVTRTYVVDYGIHKAGDVEHLRGMEHCPFELRDEPNISALKRYVWVYYGNEWHKTNFYEDIVIPDKPIDPNPDLPDPKPDPDPDPTPEQPKDYLCFTTDNLGTITLEQKGTPTVSAGKFIKYKIDDGGWELLGSSMITLTNGDKMYIKSDDNIPMSESTEIYKYFNITGNISASGNIMSLLNFTDTLTDYAFYSLFKNCKSLIQAPALPAITLANYCYSNMFEGCTSLTTAPELPATTLANYCYDSMFFGCTSLTTAPTILPATTLANYCYEFMFKNCTSLTTAPELPATTLANYCYRDMFTMCTALAHAPELPATTLVEGCYRSMFLTCKSLVTAPELPATTLVKRCYMYMFTNCEKLNYVKAMFTDISAQDCLTKWLDNVSTAGTFVKNASATWANAGIPSGWIVQANTEKPYLCFTSTGDSTVAMTQNGTPNKSANKVIQYKLNDGQWQNWNLSAVSLADGDKMYIKSDDTIPISESDYVYKKFVMTGSISASGNIMSLLNFSYTLTDHAFYFLFRDCASLKTAPSLLATTLATYCYSYMFNGCTSLTTAPALPATTLAPYCYANMFNKCAITQAPKLPATTLTNYCYYSMFKYCTSLTQAPDLPATTLAKSCYLYMFSNCTSLTVAQRTLHATQLTYRCYSNMFAYCTSLTQAPALPATTLYEGCYESMFDSCTSLTTAPVLPATTLANDCYLYMFINCSKLNYVKALFTDIPAEGCTNGWLSHVAETGTFVKNASATWDVTGVNGIPYGWTVQTA